MTFEELFDRRKLLGRLIVSISLIAFGAIAVYPQGTSPSPPKQGDKKAGSSDVWTDLVTLTLTVTDNYGRFVSGLDKDAFSVWDNKTKQNITFFSDSDAPVSIGILFDVSGSMDGGKILKARNALERFINTSHPRDEYYLIAFNKRAQLLMDRTRDGEAGGERLTLVDPKHNTAL